MMGGRGVRDAGFARHRPQRQPGEPLALEHPFGGCEQAFAQRAVMVRRISADGAGAAPAGLPGGPRRGDARCRAPGPGNFGGSGHRLYIDHDFDTVKISA